MNSIKIGYSEQMLLALLRSALHQSEVETTYFSKATENDWIKCFRQAVHQGVAALAFGGIERLPLEYSPPLNVKLSWALVEQEQVEQYKKQCKALSELTQIFARHSIGVVVLKGVGLSRLYPVPARRESGDIDIYTYSTDRSKMSDEEANILADDIIVKYGAAIGNSPSDIHSKFSFNDITFENHKMFIDEAECQTIVKSEEWLKKHINAYNVELLDGNLKIDVPSLEFDTVFIPLHAAHHYGCGLSLKHLCDWTLLIKNTNFDFKNSFIDKYYERTTRILTQLCDELFNLNVSNIKGDRFANTMLKEILYPPYYRNKDKWVVGKVIYRLLNRIHIFNLKHRILGISFSGKIMGLCLRIFSKRGED